MPAETDFVRFRGDSEPPFGPIFGTFRHLLGGSGFRSIFDRFSGHFWQGPAVVGRPAEAHSESADTEESKGHRPPPHHALHPEGVLRISQNGSF